MIEPGRRSTRPAVAHAPCRAQMRKGCAREAGVGVVVERGSVQVIGAGFGDRTDVADCAEFALLLTLSILTS